MFGKSQEPNILFPEVFQVELGNKIREVKFLEKFPGFLFGTFPKSFFSELTQTFSIELLNTFLISVNLREASSNHSNEIASAFETFSVVVIRN